MKKIVALVLALLVILSFCGCEKNNGAGGVPSSGSDLSWEEIQRQAEKELAAEG